jgi:hypothetical protein
MASDNGITELNVNGKTAPLTTDEFAVMVDASEKPVTTPGAMSPRAAASARRRGTLTDNGTTDGTALAGATSHLPELPEKDVQAARDRLYDIEHVPLLLRPIFNRLPPEEIVFVVGHIKHYYQMGYSQGAQQATGGVAECNHGPAMQRYNEVISALLHAVSFLDGDDPNVDACLRHADKAHEILTAT